MDYLSGVLHDLRRYEATHGAPETNAEPSPSLPPAAITRPSTPTPRQSRLGLFAIAGEIEAASLLVGVSCAIVNALEARAVPSHGIDALPAFSPAPRLVLSGQAERLLASGIDEAALAALQAFHAGLDLASQLGRQYATQPVSATGLSGGVHIEVLAGSWRDLVARSLQLRSELARALDHPPGTPPQRETTDRLLLAVARGEWPCVRDDGSIEVPGWAERRRDARQRVTLPVTVHTLGRRIIAALTDVSSGGVGLRGLKGLDQDTSVEIELADGRRLSGRIAWHVGDITGIALHQRLPSDDPLLQTSARR